LKKIAPLKNPIPDWPDDGDSGFHDAMFGLAADTVCDRKIAHYKDNNTHLGSTEDWQLAA
jgi:hypothetical protein